MAIAVCPTCGAQFIDGVHHWSGTGKRGNPHDLAGLVCNPFNRGRECINPCKGSKSGMSLADRGEFDEKMQQEISRVLNP
jgi:hypothetical protein